LAEAEPLNTRALDAREGFAISCVGKWSTLRGVAVMTEWAGEKANGRRVGTQAAHLYRRYGNVVSIIGTDVYPAEQRQWLGERTTAANPRYVRSVVILQLSRVSYELPSHKQSSGPQALYPRGIVQCLPL
jgi:hypothetical protein